MDPKRVRQRGAKPKQAAPELLRHLFVCDVLADAALNELSRLSRIASAPKHEQIDWEEEGSGAIIGVLEGMVRISFLSLDGRELPVVNVSAGHVVELDEDGWAGVDATVVTATSSSATCCVIPQDLFERIVSNCAEAVILLRREERAWRKELGGLASDGLYARPDTRIDHVLWRATRGAAGQSAVVTQEILAGLSRTTQPAVSREINRLIREGIVAVERKEHRIVVLYPDRLIENDEPENG